MDPLAVLVAGPDPLARAGLVALVAGREELRVVGEAAPAEVERAAPATGAATVLWDLGVDGGVEALASGQGLAVVVLAATAADGADALRAGARSVLLRGAAAEVVAGALVASARGLVVLDPELAEAWLRPPGPAAAGEGLTPREREVLSLLAEGLGNKGIAARLRVSEHTAKFHVNAILGKLGVESRAEAIVQAARMGLVTL